MLDRLRRVLSDIVPFAGPEKEENNSSVKYLRASEVQEPMRDCSPHIQRGLLLPVEIKAVRFSPI
jgi:hypothetical protein